VELDITNMKGETTTVEVSEGTAVRDLKAEIEKQNGAHFLSQMLFHSGEEDELKMAVLVTASMSPLSLIVIPGEELHLSLWNGCSGLDDKTVQVALDAGADANWTHLGYNKRPVLQQSLRSTEPSSNQELCEIVAVLLEAGADPRNKDHLGDPALTYLKSGLCLNIYGAPRAGQNGARNILKLINGHDETRMARGVADGTWYRPSQRSTC
jgi:hypothetical protein